MSDATIPPVGSEPDDSAMSRAELHIEREKIQIERERLTRERERMAAERERWKSEAELKPRAEGRGIGSRGGGKPSTRPISVGHVMSESLKNYRPEKIDLDAGWFLNNWILHKMGLRKLGPEGCSWMEGHPNEPGWQFCGKPRERGRSYCFGHCDRAYQAG